MGNIPYDGCNPRDARSEYGEKASQDIAEALGELVTKYADCIEYIVRPLFSPG